MIRIGETNVIVYSVISILFFYVGRSLINPNEIYFKKVQDVQRRRKKERNGVHARVLIFFEKERSCSISFFFLHETLYKKNFLITDSKYSSNIIEIYTNVLPLTFNRSHVTIDCFPCVDCRS